MWWQRRISKVVWQCVPGRWASNREGPTAEHRAMITLYIKLVTVGRSYRCCLLAMSDSGLQRLSILSIMLMFYLPVIFMFVATTTAATTTTTLPTSKFAFAVLFATYASSSVTLFVNNTRAFNVHTMFSTSVITFSPELLFSYS